MESASAASAASSHNHFRLGAADNADETYAADVNAGTADAWLEREDQLRPQPNYLETNGIQPDADVMDGMDAIFPTLSSKTTRRL
jgi:hypothetical protein